MKHAFLTVLIGAAILLWASSGTARADMLYFNGLGLYDVVTWHDSNSHYDDKQLAAGQFLVSYKGNDYTGYCVDLEQPVGSSEITELSPLTLPNGYLVAYLFETYGGSVTTGASAAALQVAMWEVMYETTGVFNALSGHSYITDNAAVGSAANDMLANLPFSYTPGPDTIVLHDETTQDVIVPEPASLAVAGFGGLLVLLRRRARRQIVADP